MDAERFLPLSAAQRRNFGWLDASALKKVITALETAEPGSARFVGGCVRDSLLGQTPKDFDVATTLKPDEIIKALEAANLRFAPTGVEHGTITAIVDHQGVEVTTLRKDVSTDGRRATVAFTRHWSEDAVRRDFTMNAIYLSPDGSLFDPVGGLRDVKDKCVRFIGDPLMRIREDYLRILRFYRFTARFSEVFEAAGRRACEENKDGIAQLSAERIGAELAVILSLPRAAFAVSAMQEDGVLQEIWSAPANIGALVRLKEIFPRASAPLALAVLFGERGDGIGARLRLSNAEKAIRSHAVKDASALLPTPSERAVRSLIYRLGRDRFQDAAATAYGIEQVSRADYKNLTDHLEAWRAPVFALSGRHIIAAGVEPGPAVAKILSAIESQWIDEDFPDSGRLNEIMKVQIAAAQP